MNQDLTLQDASIKDLAPLFYPVSKVFRNQINTVSVSKHERTVITVAMNHNDYKLAKANFESKTSGPITIELAKNNTILPYKGQILFITDTHILQRVNSNSSVLHEFSKLSNGAELNAAVDAGKLKPGSQLEVSYLKDHGKADVVPFNRLRAEIVQREVVEWAKENIKSPKALETFLATMEKATVAISADRSLQAADMKRPACQTPVKSKDVAERIR